MHSKRHTTQVEPGDDQQGHDHGYTNQHPARKTDLNAKQLARLGGQNNIGRRTNQSAQSTDSSGITNTKDQ